MKLNRAVEHLDRLNKSAEGFFEKDLQIRVVPDLNSQRTKYLFRCDETPVFPDVEWGIAVGDAVHCLRSALDQLVYGLATQRSVKTQFPICRTRRKWVTEAPVMYWSVPEKYVAVIDRAQPYHRGDGANDHPLAILSALSNLDKHRTIPATTLVSAETVWRITSTEGIKSWSKFKLHPGVALVKGAVLAEASIVPDDSGVQPKMYMEATTKFDIGFGDIAETPSVSRMAVLRWFDQVLNPFIGNEIFKPTYAASLT